MSDTVLGTQNSGEQDGQVPCLFKAYNPMRMAEASNWNTAVKS